MVVVHPHFQLFLYVFTFVAAVCLGLLFVKQKGPGVADSDTLPRTVAEFDRILRESTKVADFEQILANQNYVDQKCKEAAAVEQIEQSLQGSRAAYDARVGDDRTSMRWDFACPACGHGEAFFKKLQIRSAPWPQHRIFYRCCGRGCRHRWKEEPEIDD